MEKEEPDEDEEIYVIEPKPEPKFRRQIFRDKDRVILLTNFKSNKDKVLIVKIKQCFWYYTQVMKPTGDWGDFEDVGVDIEPDRKLRSKWGLKFIMMVMMVMMVMMMLVNKLRSK